VKVGLLRWLLYEDTDVLLVDVDVAFIDDPLPMLHQQVCSRRTDCE
jgi:hypothetical protein